MEPFRSLEPPAGYLEEVRRLCDRHRVPLIFDEISCGLRIAPGGAQEYFGVVPDLTVLGKALGNGYAIAAVAGRRDVMEPAARMFISSTFWSEPLGLAAGLATLRAIQERGVCRHLWKLGAELKDRLNVAAAATGCPVQCVGLSIHPTLRFDVEDALLSRQVTTLYIQEMARRGCHGYSSFYLNAAQGLAEIEETTAAAEEVFRIIAAALDAGQVGRLLECEPAQDPFRRLVR